MGGHKSVNSRRTHREQLLRNLGEPASREWPAVGELVVSVRKVPSSRHARVSWDACGRQRHAGVARPCWNGPGQGRRLAARRRSWFVDRALRQERAVGEPMIRVGLGSVLGPAHSPAVAHSSRHLLVGERGRTGQPGSLPARAASRPGRAAAPPPSPTRRPRRRGDRQRVVVRCFVGGLAAGSG